MAEEKLSRSVHHLRQFIAEQNWSIVDEKEIAHGYQFLVTDGQSKVPIALYTTGKTLVQGKASSLQATLKAWSPTQTLANKPATQQTGQTETRTASPISSKTQASNGIARIGSDESGKGDFYGPLVVAAVYVDQKTEQRLLQLGVRDSKKLTDTLMLNIANEIRTHCPYAVRVYLPADYNELYQRIGNLNLLLAQAHADVIAQVASATGSTYAIVDQFGNEALVRRALEKTGIIQRLEQRHRAEEDTAVAAASIVARVEFIRHLSCLSASIGVDLPKGGSHPQIVIKGRQIVSQHGEEALKQIAKLHFKTTDAILHP
ncbi:ribonuclease HIII [Dictyobacter arantiisoli]|uniref:Ribonuclease n=1 Tax=Dictyobacter arantiisoli TaxID=2014874 RepID=A0A5A5TEW9_9CHLR|nr:ribonuclease HIII [Dictyobacter arantiisoli]GCF10110.1 ribonuclease HIII [Dictyobacter arantiisoli]